MDVGKAMYPLQIFFRDILLIRYRVLLRQMNQRRHVCAVFPPLERIYLDIGMIGEDGMTVPI